MKRRVLLALAAAAAGAPRLLFAQESKHRIGYLLLSPVTEPPSRERQAFLDGLRDLGYEPGRNVEFAYASAEGQVDFLDDVCRDLLAKKPDLVVVAGGEATVTARNATRSVPVVFLALGDPVGLGVVASLARPGGNVTGVSFISSDLAAKRIEYLRETAPAVRRVAVLWDEKNRNAEIEARAAIAALKRFGMTPQRLPLAASTPIGRSLARLEAAKPGALYVAFSAGAIADNRTVIAEFGLQQRIPVVSGWSFMTEAGGLLSYAPNIPAMFRRGAYYVDRILRGDKPASLPVEQARIIELVVNVRTAKAIGVALPQSLMLRADRVID